MTRYTVDTAIGTLPTWAVWVDSDCEHWADPIDAWLRIIDPNGDVEIVPAQYVYGALRPMEPQPSSVHHTRAEAEKALRRALAALWRRELPELLRTIAELSVEEREPSRLRETLMDWDRQAAAATDQRTAYEALVRGGYLTAGRAESTRQVPKVGGRGMEYHTTPAEPCELTPKGRKLAGLDTD